MGNGSVPKPGNFHRRRVVLSSSAGFYDRLAQSSRAKQAKKRKDKRHKQNSARTSLPRMGAEVAVGRRQPVRHKNLIQESVFRDNESSAATVSDFVEQLTNEVGNQLLDGYEEVVEIAGDGMSRASVNAKSQPSTKDMDRDNTLAVIRELYRIDPTPCGQAELLQLMRDSLGHLRLSDSIRIRLERDLRVAERRHVLQRVKGMYRLKCRSICDYNRNQLKKLFLQAIGRNWSSREAAIIAGARYLGFRRTGRAIQSAFRSIINGLIRERRLQSVGDQIRRV